MEILTIINLLFIFFYYFLTMGYIKSFFFIIFLTMGYIKSFFFLDLKLKFEVIIDLVEKNNDKFEYYILLN